MHVYTSIKAFSKSVEIVNIYNSFHPFEKKIGKICLLVGFILKLGKNLLFFIRTTCTYQSC